MVHVFPDFREEFWHSMDLCADMLIKYAPVESKLVMSLPRYRRLSGFLPSKIAKNFDRWFNRWKVYPNHVKKLASQQSFFHIVDHSYAHLANYLPDGKVGIYCHDFDAFKCVLTPEDEPRPIWFKMMMSKVFDGFKKARVVFCNTKATQKNILDLAIWKKDQVFHVPLGVAEEFSPFGDSEDGLYILHVGSCIARKRIDILLQAFSQVYKNANRPNLKLIQAGGIFSIEHRKRILDLDLEGRVEQRQNLTRKDLARLYRGAKCLVITSDAEGFGLPVIEGLSCGIRVVASAIPALQEVGGTDIEYFAPGNSNACAETILKNLDSPAGVRYGLSEKWSWTKHAQRICDVYESIGN